MSERERKSGSREWKWDVLEIMFISFACQSLRLSPPTPPCHSIELTTPYHRLLSTSSFMLSSISLHSCEDGDKQSWPQQCFILGPVNLPCRQATENEDPYKVSPWLLSMQSKKGQGKECVIFRSSALSSMIDHIPIVMDQMQMKFTIDCDGSAPKPCQHVPIAPGLASSASTLSLRRTISCHPTIPLILEVLMARRIVSCQTQQYHYKDTV